MGMFDYITYNGQRFQTKTFDCTMDDFRVENGRIVHDEWHYEAVPEDELPYAKELKDPNTPERMRGWYRLFGSLRRVIDRQNVDMNYHGIVTGCRDTSPYQDFVAKFTDGNLVEWTVFPPEDARS